MNPDSPIYIVSKGRADSRLTSKTLHALGVPHFIVVEEQEVDAYERAADSSAKILMLPRAYQREYDTCDDLGDSKSKGPGPARNFAWDHAADSGHDWHWVMDDNIQGFFRLNHNLKTPVGDGTVFRVMEEFCDRYTNVAMAGPNYFMFASRKSQMPAFVLNTRIYSCNLIRNDVPFRWRGRYNEDTILSLDMLKEGWQTVQFNAFLQGKVTTQTLGGGNTAEFYAAEGTLAKSQMLVDVHPDVARHQRRFGRDHHYVDYGPFKEDRLNLKTGAAVEQGINDYGMVLQQERGGRWITIPTDEALTAPVPETRAAPVRRAARPVPAETRDRRLARSSLRLYPYQRVGAAFLATARAALLGDDMGVGKTPETIRALQLLEAEGEAVFPALVVAPATVKRVWERELEKWAPELRVVVPGSGTAAAERALAEIAEGRADVLVLNYEALPNVSRLAPYGSIRLEGCVNCDPLSSRAPAKCQRERKAANEIPWRTIVADEAHRAKDPHTQTTRALWALGDGAEFRFALTGSPLANSPEDLWSVMRFVAPAEYARKGAWVDRYVETQPNMFSGYADAVGFKPATREEFDKFFLPRFLRRPKAAVLPDLPPKTYMQRDVVISGKQAKAYDDMRKGMIAKVDDGTIYATNPLVELLRLRQFASAYAEADGLGGMTLAAPSSKLDALEDVLRELGDRQAVIFAESRQLIDLAHERLGDDAVLITGTVSEEDRAKNVDRFQNGDVRYVLATIAAGGVGLTLTAADTAIFLQRSFNAVLNTQAEDRIHRVGQESDNVTIVDLVTIDTVEDRVREVLADKAARLEDLVRDRDTLRRWLS